jgi:hypothetical protein
VLGMSGGASPDLRYLCHSALDFSPRLRTNSRASLKGRKPATRRLPVPSQSPQLDQPDSAYLVSGLAGMSAGFLPDLQYSRHSVSDLIPRLRTNARASLKDRNLRKLSAIRPVPSQSPQLVQPAFAYTPWGCDGISAGLSPLAQYCRQSVADFKPSDFYKPS